jgi:hypothetical protein
LTGAGRLTGATGSGRDRLGAAGSNTVAHFGQMIGLLLRS